MSTSGYQVWKEIEDRFKFLLLLAVLCSCGYLAWGKFIYIFLALIFGGLAAADARLYEVVQEKQNEIDGSGELKLIKLINEHTEAYAKIEKFLQKNPDFATNLANLSNIQQTINQTHFGALTQYRYQKDQRENRENLLLEHRRNKQLNYGSPPNSDNTCPSGYPIRATENLRSKRYKNESSRGIYYQKGEPEYESQASWCFESSEHAEKDNFRKSRKPGRR